MGELSWLSGCCEPSCLWLGFLTLSLLCGKLIWQCSLIKSSLWASITAYTASNKYLQRRDHCVYAAGSGDHLLLPIWTGPPRDHQRCQIGQQPPIIQESPLNHMLLQWSHFVEVMEGPPNPCCISCCTTGFFLG